MNSRISLFLLSSIQIVFISPSFAQKMNKSDKAIIAHLSSHFTHLSEETKTGELKETSVINYISSQFTLLGIEPKGDNGTYIHSFEIPEGMVISAATCLIINGDEIKSNAFFPLAGSPTVNLEAAPSLSLQEAGQPWFFDLKETLEDSSTGEIRTFILAKASEVKKKGCTALFVYNTSSVKDGLNFDGKEWPAELPIPVIYVSGSIARKHFSDETAMLDIKLKTAFAEKKRSGKYIVGFINNNAAKTIMIGTNESADNAATFIEVGNLLKNSKSKNNNYLLVAFFDQQNEGANPASPQNETIGKSAAANYTINVSGTAEKDKLNYIYTIVEKAK